MIQLICGVKGSGKTKRLLDMVNQEVESTQGDIVFIDDNKRYMYDVKHQVRFVDVSEYKIASAEGLYGFLCGMLAQNFDLSAIYMDAFLHIIKEKPEELTDIINQMKELAEKHNIKMVLNISADLKQLSSDVVALAI